MTPLYPFIITNEQLDYAFPQRSAREDLRDLVLSGVSGLSVLDQQTIVPARDYEPYRSIDIPSVFSIPLTEKLAPVYAPTSPPLTTKKLAYPVSDVDTFTRYYEPPVNSFADTVLTNPTALSLETIPVYEGSQLEANYQQVPATLSGQDSVLVPVMNRLAEQQTDSSQLLSSSTTSDECWIPGITSGCWLRKDVRNESMVFIVGAIVLAIGIFALVK